MNKKDEGYFKVTSPKSFQLQVGQNGQFTNSHRQETDVVPEVIQNLIRSTKENSRFCKAALGVKRDHQQLSLSVGLCLSVCVSLARALSVSLSLSFSFSLSQHNEGSEILPRGPVE